MAEDRNKLCYTLLLKVFRDNAWAGLELDKILKGLPEIDRPYLTKLFYGVLDKSIQFDYIITKLCEKKPQVAVIVLIKMGLYMLDFMDIPSYAAVNNIVNLAKSVGKSGASGFINAVLRGRAKVEFPLVGTLENLSVEYSYPLWLVKIINKDYGFDFAKSYLSADIGSLTHIRHNNNIIKKQEFEQKYQFLADCKSPYGYYVSHSLSCKLENCDYIVQSLASIIAVHEYLKFIKLQSPKILDLCAAPGGKAVLLKELLPKSNVVACDIHEHRVELIKKYAANCMSDIAVLHNDATIVCDEFIDNFDLVVCDAPCSGIGVVGSKPDILLNRKYEDIAKLNELQLAILDTAAKYVKIGGVLCYSTCTIIKKENEDVANAFISSHPNFVINKLVDNIDGYKRLYPQTDGTDGFFVASFTRIK